MGTSRTVVKIRSALVRPLDRRYPTNLAVMILAPAAGAVVGAVGLSGHPSLADALEWAAPGGLTVFAGWALAREIAPDDNPGRVCQHGAGAADASCCSQPPACFRLFTAIMLARMVNRSVGIPATVVDSTAVTLLAGWTAYSTGSSGPALVAAVGFGLDAVLPSPLRRQWVFAIVCLAGGLVFPVLGDTAPRSSEASWALTVSGIDHRTGLCPGHLSYRTGCARSPTSPEPH